MLIIAAIILSVTVTAFAFPNTRKYIIRKFQNHFSYSVVKKDNIIKVDNLTTEYIPAGFCVTEERNLKVGSYRKYEKDDLWFSVFKNPIDAEINYDETNQEIIMNNNMEYIVYSTKSTIGVIWNDGIYTYKVTGNISKDNMMDIAFSTK